jgi:CHAT domain-containing protein
VVRRLVARWLANPDDVALADELGAALLPEDIRLAESDREGSPLFIAPSTSLARVPFSALRRHGRRLIEDQVLAQIPSFNALAALRQPRPATGRPRSPMILADTARDLPEAVVEARAVAKRLGHEGAIPRLYIGQDAVTDRLREAQGASVLHLAVHSGVGMTGPWLRLHDRVVVAAEVLDWRIAADLVVLASCASAATPDPGLWGSLVASFLASGSTSVVGSLWSTKDRVSREFVESFYDKGGVRDPALALARTQRAWLAQKRPVGDWAAFAFYGLGR